MKKLISWIVLMSFTMMAGCASLPQQQSTQLVAAPAPTQIAAPSAVQAPTPYTNAMFPIKNPRMVATGRFIGSYQAMVQPLTDPSKCAGGWASKGWTNPFTGDKFLQLVTYNGHQLTMEQFTLGLKELESVEPLMATSTQENTKITLHCADDAVYKPATPVAAPAAVAPAPSKPAAPAYTQTDFDAAIAKAVVAQKAAPAAAPAQKPVKTYNFYADFIKRTGYTVKGFQKANCLKVDGVIGKETTDFIDKLIDGVPSGCEPEPPAAPAAKEPAKK